MVSTLALVLLYHFVTLRLIIFPRWKNFLMIQDFCRQRSFPQAKIFSLITEVFHKFKFFLDQGRFTQAKIFPWSRKLSANKNFSLIKKVFHKQRFFLDKANFHGTDGISLYSGFEYMKSFRTFCFIWYHIPDKKTVKL